jgi:hypothetical protein
MFKELSLNIAVVGHTRKSIVGAAVAIASGPRLALLIALAFVLSCASTLCSPVVVGLQKG